jgi:hypothetical protein
MSCVSTTDLLTHSLAESLAWVAKECMLHRQNMSQQRVFRCLLQLTAANKSIYKRDSILTKRMADILDLQQAREATQRCVQTNQQFSVVGLFHHG